VRDVFPKVYDNARLNAPCERRCFRSCSIGTWPLRKTHFRTVLTSAFGSQGLRWFKGFNHKNLRASAPSSACPFNGDAEHTTSSAGGRDDLASSFNHARQRRSARPFIEISIIYQRLQNSEFALL